VGHSSWCLRLHSFSGPKRASRSPPLLLAGNNVVKIVAYRQTLPYLKPGAILVALVFGTVLGAQLLVAAPEKVVTVAIIAAFATSVVTERLDPGVFED
jgi:uncharacterized protein